MKNLDETTIKELNDYCGLQILESDIQYVVPNLTKKEIEKELNIIQRKLGSEAEKREVILQYLRKFTAASAPACRRCCPAKRRRCR